MKRRRVVYLDDETWAAMAESAKTSGTTVSEAIRRRLAPEAPPEPKRALTPSEVLSRVNRGKG